MNRESSCVQFLESQREKIEQLMRTGDIVSHERERTYSADCMEKTKAVMNMLKMQRDGKKVYTVNGACSEVGISNDTYYRYRRKVQK